VLGSSGLLRMPPYTRPLSSGIDRDGVLLGPFLDMYVVFGSCGNGIVGGGPGGGDAIK
jgi:hypothetical protein